MDSDEVLENRLKAVSLTFEVQNTFKYIRRGLGEVQRISEKNAFYEAPLLFLSTGFERLFKVMICMNYREANGRYPTHKELLQGNNGHDIFHLKRRVEKFCVPLDYPFAIDDYTVITENETIDFIFSVLGEFGKRARYFNLDIVVGNANRFDARKEWEKIETILMISHYGKEKFYEMVVKPEYLSEMYQKSNELIIKELEQFLRAIARQFRLGSFSKESRIYAFQTMEFSDINDDQLGKTDYRQYESHEWIRRK